MNLRVLTRRNPVIVPSIAATSYLAFGFPLAAAGAGWFGDRLASGILASGAIGFLTNCLCVVGVRIFRGDSIKNDEAVDVRTIGFIGVGSFFTTIAAVALVSEIADIRGYLGILAVVTMLEVFLITYFFLWLLCREPI